MIIRRCTCGRLLGFKWGGWRMWGLVSHGLCQKCVEAMLREVVA